MQRKIDKAKKIIFLTIALFAAIFFIEKMDSNTRVDIKLQQLDSLYSPMKKYLYPTYSISFKSNDPTNDVYFRSQFLLAPIVLDTVVVKEFILVYEDTSKSGVSVTDSAYLKIDSTSLHTMKAVLFLKKKR